jgi:hypothetical protein
MPTDALVNEDVLSLVNGVSEQPAHQRLTSQHEVQTNMLSDEADGVTDRPPMEHVAQLTGSVTSVPTGGFKIHTIDRGDGQQFGVFLEDGDINVYDLSDGSEVTVNDNAAGTPGSYTYLDFDTSQYTAEEAFAVVTIADYTFIVNRTIAAAMSGVASAGRENAHEGIVWTQRYVTNNSIRFDVAGTRTNTAGSAATSHSIIDQVLNTMGFGLGAYPTAPGQACTAAPWLNWSAFRDSGNSIYLWQDDVSGGEESLDVTDSDGWGVVQIARTGVNGEDPEVSRFSDLPPVGHDGFVVKVSGDDGNDQDDFYVKYDEDEAVWKETVKPGLDDNFDEDTMPHALVYNEGTGQFSFEPITWLARLVGDTESAPEPSFVGKTISDVFLHQNRLCFVADENVIASEAGEFFNFWPTTVTTLVDSDPIDTAGTGDTVAIWDFAIPYRGNVTCFSATGGVISELVGSRDENLKVENARLVERLYQDFSALEPVNLEDTLYFLDDNGTNSRVFAYTQVDVDVWRADEITAHVPRFLPPSIVRMSGSSVLRALALISDDGDEDNRLYLYRYFNVGNEQVMSSWSKWEIDSSGQILSADFIDSVMYLFIARGSTIHLEKADFAKVEEDSTLGYRVHLDSLVELTGTPIGGGTTTWFTPAYSPTDLAGAYRVIKTGAWGADRGQEIPVVAIIAGTIICNGDQTANPVYVGRVYDRTLELSEQFVRTGRTGRSENAIIEGRLNLKRGKVAVKDSNAFDVEIRSRRDPSAVDIEPLAAEDFDVVNGDKYTNPVEGVLDFTIGDDARDARILFVNSADYPWLPIGKLSRVSWTGRFFQASENT